MKYLKALLTLLVTAGVFLEPSWAQEELQANTIDVTVQRIRTNDQTIFELRASGFVTAPPDKVWKVLTDYNRLQEFVPNLQSSRIISHSGQETIIDQTGTSGFLFISKTIHIVVRAVEYPVSRIDIHLVSGDMKQYAVRWELAPLSINGISGTRITYSGTLEPDFFVPPFIGTSIVQADVKKMMQALVTEITR
jgi:ribosome-associated toxin RatA of RatAB toxin-antitoxin module